MQVNADAVAARQQDSALNSLFEAGSFDLNRVSSGFQQRPDIVPALVAFGRVLQPGGIFCDENLGAGDDCALRIRYSSEDRAQIALGNCWTGHKQHGGQETRKHSVLHALLLPGEKTW